MIVGENISATNRAMLPGQKMAYAHLGDLLVLGLGVTGKAASTYLASLLGDRVESLTILGGKSDAKIREWADGLLANNSGARIDVVFDEEDASRVLPQGADGFDLCIASPGISCFSEMYLGAARVSRELISEVELAWRESAKDSRWAAITGTNGKTTTTSLLNHILGVAGMSSCAVGNIGRSCMAQVADDLQNPSQTEGGEVYVVEVSSYQLASIKDFAPDVAIILGITPDHLKWHKTHEHYAASKFKMLDNMGVYGVAVLDAVNDEVRQKVRELKGRQTGTSPVRYIPIGATAGLQTDMRKACGASNSAFLDGEVLTVSFEGEDHSLIDAKKLKILGPHNQLNSLAAAGAAVALGADDASIAKGLATFTPLEHRIEPAGEVAGVAFYNDSKATNVDATLVAICAFDPIRPIVMLGGDDKGTDLAELVQGCKSHAKACVCYGAAGRRFYEALNVLEHDGIDVRLTDTFKGAFDLASDMAESGDIVLLSPACASFDEFSCFEERGDRFKECVKELGR